MSTPPAGNGGDKAGAVSRAARFETVVLVLLSLATVGTAWCSYQAAAWGGVSQRMMNLSVVSGRDAVVAELQAYQVTLLDVLLFTEYVNARAATNAGLTQFYEDRFRDEAKVAFRAWLATHPFENTNAPAHPFLPQFYRPKLMEEAQRWEAERQVQWQQAGEAGRVSRAFVLITVMFACVLFCGGVASRFETGWVRRAVVWLGVGGFVVAVAKLVALPVHL